MSTTYKDENLSGYVDTNSPLKSILLSLRWELFDIKSVILFIC
jgi:hypothetical protein